jgi:chromosome segregation ATPase
MIFKAGDFQEADEFYGPDDMAAQANMKVKHLLESLTYLSTRASEQTARADRLQLLVGDLERTLAEERDLSRQLLNKCELVVAVCAEKDARLAESEEKVKTLSDKANHFTENSLRWLLEKAEKRLAELEDHNKYLNKECSRVHSRLAELEKNRDGHLEANRRLAAELGKLEKMIAEGPVVYGWKHNVEGWKMSQTEISADTHSARLVQIKELK